MASAEDRRHASAQALVALDHKRRRSSVETVVMPTSPHQARRSSVEAGRRSSADAVVPFDVPSRRPSVEPPFPRMDAQRRRSSVEAGLSPRADPQHRRSSVEAQALLSPKPRRSSVGLDDFVKL